MLVFPVSPANVVEYPPAPVIEPPDGAVYPAGVVHVPPFAEAGFIATETTIRSPTEPDGIAGETLVAEAAVTDTAPDVISVTPKLDLEPTPVDDTADNALAPAPDTIISTLAVPDDAIAGSSLVPIGPLEYQLSIAASTRLPINA
jgi:hypothetical protein